MIDIVVLSGAAAPNFFLTDLAGACTIDDFPVAGENTRVDWAQAAQSFAISASGMGVPSGGTCPDEACPADMMAVGAVCVDTYEASVWANAEGTGMQYGVTEDDYPCADTGNDCKDMIYAVSRKDALPARFITWFQAQQACVNAGKRLLRNAERQAAAAGTPDPGDTPGGEDCKTMSAVPEGTGSRANCVSAWGAFDMVGNVWEWVADWGPASTRAVPAVFDGTEDVNLMGGARTTRGPGALVRGGHFGNGTAAGVFAVVGISEPSDANSSIGFRCVR